MVDGAKSKKGKNGQINRVTIQSSLSASSRCHLVSLLPTLRKGHGVVPLCLSPRKSLLFVPPLKRPLKRPISGTESLLRGTATPVLGAVIGSESGCPGGPPYKKFAI